MNGSHSTTPRVLIVGAGFSGIAMGIRLKRSGFDSFSILEKANEIGGTWRENTYPGAACDIPSFSYCYSFEQKKDWTRKWAGHAEILAYLRSCVDKYGLRPHVRFGSNVEAARFDDEAKLWRVRVSSGDTESVELEAEVLVSAVGQLDTPSIPEIPGLECFEGASFHSARWNHDCDLIGKRIGVIGNAASAVQFIPEIARGAAKLTIFQRSANWVVPRGDRRYSEWETRVFQSVPVLARLYRWAIWARQEVGLFAIRGNKGASRWFERIALRNMNEHVADPHLRAVLTPDYRLGAKRVLVHDDFYPTVSLKNVSIETSAIAWIDRAGVTTDSGDHHELDVLIFATGFETNPFLSPMMIEGSKGRLLSDRWKSGAEAYLGMAVPGFPNFFMMYGPNTNLAHNSIVFMIECQANYIAQCVDVVRDGSRRALSLRPQVMRDFNSELQRNLSRTTWVDAKQSWYMTSGRKITTNWPSSTIRYWLRTRRVGLDDYEDPL